MISSEIKDSMRAGEYMPQASRRAACRPFHASGTFNGGGVPRILNWLSRNVSSLLSAINCSQSFKRRSSFSSLVNALASGEAVKQIIGICSDENSLARGIGEFSR